MKGQLSTLGREGHVVTKWDTDAPETVDEARVAFDQMVGDGFAAFEVIAVNPAVSTKEQVREFNPAAREIVMVGPHVGG